MGEIRTQILSNETVNRKGYIVINSSLKWDNYKKNPILQFNPDTGEHQGIAIGRVENIRLQNGNWVGNLIFGNSELAQRVKQDYDDGVLNAVSIYGTATIAKRNGRRYTTVFEVWEISLVNIPANPDCVAIRSATDGLSVNFECIEETVCEGLSATDIEMINKFESTMTNENQELDKQETPQDEMVSLSAVERIMKNSADSFLRLIGKNKSKIESNDADGWDEPDRTQALSKEDVKPKESTETEQLSVEDQPEPQDEDTSDEDGLSAEPAVVETPEVTEKPAGLSVSENANVLNINEQIKPKKYNKMNVPFSRYIFDEANAEKIKRVYALASPSEDSDGICALSAEGVNSDDYHAIQELAASMVADKGFMAIAQQVHFQFNEGKTTNAAKTIEGLASGQGSANFIASNADLAVISWLSEFVRQLFPKNTWAERVRRVSVADRQGVIWVESAINPEVYFGDRAPVNAKNYMYDDNARGLSRKVFAIQPVLWQPINTDVLAYNDMATGSSEIFRILSNAIYNYWLQVIAESVPASNYVTMTGYAFDATGKFPINPAATGFVTSPTLNDLIGLGGTFLARNLEFDGTRSAVTVLAQPYFTALKQNPQLQTILTAYLSDARPDGFNYDGFDVMGRSYVAGFDTSTDTVVDAEMYMDKPVNWATGAIDDTHTRPVLTTTTYDIGLSFLPEEIILAVGNTHVHMVSDPNSYGWKMSVCTAVGAGTLRTNSDGVALLRPETATAAGNPNGVPVEITNTTTNPVNTKEVP